MGEQQAPGRTHRLALVSALLHAIGDNLLSLHRLVSEAQKEVAASIDRDQADCDDELGRMRREVDQLRDGMTSRAVIERAKGVLMHAQSVSEAKAFDVLNELSQRRRRRVRDVAADIVDGLPAARPPTPASNGAPVHQANGGTPNTGAP